MDGNVAKKNTFPTGGVDDLTKGWTTFMMGIAPGRHTLTWTVKSDSSTPGFSRSVDLNRYGTGFVYIDDVTFKEILFNGPSP